jgi:hypothetical protein
MVAAPADPAVVQRVIAEAGVESRMPPPDWSTYAEAIVAAFRHWFHGWGGPVGTLFVGYAWLATAIVSTLAVVIAAWLLVLVIRSARGTRPGTRRGGQEVHRGPVAPLHDARAWREELERRLQAGRVGPALEAFWWWFACSLTGRADVERSRTSRELVRESGRREWSEPARELDRWLYGPRRPDIGDLRALLGRFERAA